MKYQLNAFRAVENIESSQEFLHGHAQILKDFGIESLTSSQDEWLNNPDVYVVAAYDEQMKMVGGVKIHLYNESHPLPVQAAIDYLDNRIVIEIKNLAANGTGEACGLWIAKEIAGKNFGQYLTRSAIALSESLGLQTLFGFSSPHTFRIFSELGYIPLTTVGDNGNFLYPSERYTSTVIIIPDVTNIEKATEINRKRTFELRKNPRQEFVESVEKNVCISYNLSIHSYV